MNHDTIATQLTNACDVLDTLIDKTDESSNIKEELKALWKELLK
jgi:hypothetical protein